jgi:hypothetical protein
MQRPILHVQCDDAYTLPIVHDEVEGEVLDEEVGVVAEGLAVEGVEEGMACAVGGGGAAVGLATFAVFEGLAAKGTLVDFALFCAGEGDAEVFQLLSLKLEGWG